MGGFTDWVEQVADSTNARDYRRRVSDAESASLWQSLSYGANYKSAYCLAVCPAGEDVIGPFLADRKTHLTDIVRPLQEKAETIYVTKNSDAEVSVAKRFPHKKIKHVGNSLRPNTIEVFLHGMPHVFQPGKSAGLHATFHFTFTGHEQRQATVVIKDQRGFPIGMAKISHMFHIFADSPESLRGKKTNWGRWAWSSMRSCCGIPCIWKPRSTSCGLKAWRSTLRTWPGSHR
jgi:hypothetical protein